MDNILLTCDLKCFVWFENQLKLKVLTLHLADFVFDYEKNKHPN